MESYCDKKVRMMIRLLLLQHPWKKMRLTWKEMALQMMEMMMKVDHVVKAFVVGGWEM